MFETGILTTAPGRRARGARPIAVSSYLHRETRAVWLDVTGELSSATPPSALVTQLRRAHRRLPRGIDVAVIDVTRIGDLTMDLAVILCLESRMLGVRDIELVVVLRTGTATPLSVHPMLERLRIWWVEEHELDELSRAAAHARLGGNGWEPLVERRRTP